MSVKAKTSGGRIVAPGCLVRCFWESLNEHVCLVVSRDLGDVCYLLEPDGSRFDVHASNLIVQAPALLGTPRRSSRRNTRNVGQ